MPGRHTDRVELRHLRYYVAVAKEENVSRAALSLHVSQPALSRQIRDLEEELGFPLLERGAKSVALTEAGRVFLTEAEAVLQRADDAVEKARQVALGGQGEIHVGYAPSLTAQILPRTLRAFQADQQRTRVILHDLSTEEMLAQLLNGQLQLAFLVKPSKAVLRGLDFEELLQSPFCVAVPPDHPFVALKTVAPEQVAREPLIAYDRRHYPEYHEKLATILGPTQIKWRIAEEHDSATSLIAAVESGAGVAIVPDSLTCISGLRLKLIPLSPPPEPIRVGAAWSKEGLPPSANRFLQLAIDLCAKL